MDADLTGLVAAALAAVGRDFGPPPAAAPRPRWGLLYSELDRGRDEGCAVDIELVYEGYLLHYRESRAVALAEDDLESRLLAGDCFYARGLRGVAARGDIHGVALLARLMAACSYLRSTGVPFHADDALWAYTTAGLAAQHAGDDPAVVAAAFDELEAGFHAESPVDVGGLVARAVPRLESCDPAPLLRELGAAVVTDPYHVR